MCPVGGRLWPWGTEYGDQPKHCEAAMGHVPAPKRTHPGALSTCSGIHRTGYNGQSAQYVTLTVEYSRTPI